LLPPKKAIKAAGNAYIVPLIIAVLQPMLMALAKSNVNHAAWSPSHLVSRELPEGLRAFEVERPCGEQPGSSASQAQGPPQVCKKRPREEELFL
jgi:hypothetical protein